MKVKQEALYKEVEKLKELKEQLNACTDDNPAKKLELINAHKAQKKVVKKIKKTLRENYIKRGMIKKIVAAWVITVPAAAVVSAIVFFVIKGLAL